MMHRLSAAELLAVWEQGLYQHPVQQALLLLQAAWPEVSVDQLAQLRLGQRNLMLLRLREQLLGPQLVGVATCTACGQQLELPLNTTEMVGLTDGEAVQAIEPPALLDLHADGYDVRFRVPNSLDLLATVGYSEVTMVRNALLKRCLLSIRYHDNEQASDLLPPEVEAMLIQRMEQADPQAHMEFAITCPFCASEWQVAFDVVQYFWRELNDWASRLLGEVHTLASAYGWHEADILALNPSRRQVYLTMVHAS